MKKSSSPHKKRTAAKRKKRSKQRKRASLKQRLARLAKNQKSFASLTAALKKAPPGALGSVEPEPEERRRRPKLGKPLVNSTVNSRDFPLHFALQQPSAQQPLSVKLNTSPPHQLIGPRQVESTVVHSASVPLWEALPRQRHYWPLASGGGVLLPEFSLLLLTHAREPKLSLLSDNYPSTAALLTFSYSTAFKHSPEKPFHQDEPNWPWSPCQSSADPRWKGAYQPDLTAVPIKPNNPDLLAGNPMDAEPLSPEDKKGDTGDEKNFFKEFLREASKPNPASQYLRKGGLGRTKHWRHYLGKPRTSISRAIGKSRGVSTGNLLNRKQRISSRGRFIRQGGLQKLLREFHEENNRSSHCQQFTQGSSAEMSRSHHPRVQPSSDASLLKPMNFAVTADNPLEAKPSSSEGKKEDIGHKKFVFEKHLPQKTIRLNLNQANKHPRKPGGFIKRSTGHAISAPRELLPESVRSTQASDYYLSVLGDLVYGNVPIPEDISLAVLTEFIQQLAQKMAALASPLGLGDGRHDNQSRSDAPASGYAAPWFSPNQYSLSATYSWNQ